MLSLVLDGFLVPVGAKWKRATREGHGGHISVIHDVICSYFCDSTAGTRNGQTVIFPHSRAMPARIPRTAKKYLCQNCRKCNLNHERSSCSSPQSPELLKMELTADPKQTTRWTSGDRKMREFPVKWVFNSIWTAMSSSEDFFVIYVQNKY